MTLPLPHEQEARLARQTVLEWLTSYSVRVALLGEPFRLASGGTSRLYVDAKRTTLHRQMQRPLGALLHAEVASIGYADAVAGVVLGGSILASTVAVTAAVRDQPVYNVLCVRKRAKDHGTGHVVEAPWSPRFGGQVVLLEDVLSTGASARAAIAALTEAGYSVVGCVTLIDRRLPADRTPTLLAPGGAPPVPLRSVYRLEDLRVEPEVARIVGPEGARVEA